MKILHLIPSNLDITLVMTLFVALRVPHTKGSGIYLHD